MKIAVAIPCYNGALHVGRCIEAVLGQSRRPDEILVIDDGSTDNSAEVALGYPVRLVRHERNLGLSSARNTALASTDAEIVAFVDVDAYADPEMLSTLLSRLSRGDVVGVGGQGVEAIQETIYDRWRSLHASQGYGRRSHEQCEYLFGLCMAYQRQVLVALEGFDTRFRTNAEDMDMGMRLNNAGYRLAYVPQAKVFHQRRDNRDSLFRNMHQWYYWAFVAKYINGRWPWRLAAGILRRLVWSDMWPDLIKLRNLELVKLDWEISWAKLQALWAAFRFLRQAGNSFSRRASPIIAHNRAVSS